MRLQDVTAIQAEQAWTPAGVAVGEKVCLIRDIVSQGVNAHQVGG